MRPKLKNGCFMIFPETAQNGKPLIARLRNDLAKRERSGLLRHTPSHIHNSKQIDLSTNSYLGLHQNQDVQNAAGSFLPLSIGGNGASRLVSVSSPLYDELENEIALWKQSESALVFNGGYSANIGIIQAVCGRDTEVFCDKFNHASIYDGIQLSRAKFSRYKHCDMNHLEALLTASNTKEKLIVTDAVFSMDGDCAPLAVICGLADKYGALVMLDEAHSAGIFGNRASGLCEAAGVEDRVEIRMGTLSKAVGGLGGFFAGASWLRSHILNHARSFIYATSLPHSVLAFDLASVKHIRNHPETGKAVLDKSEYLRRKINGIGFDTKPSISQIIPIACGDPQTALNLSRFLLSHGVKAPAIRPPTVPEGTSRVRLSLHAGLSTSQLDSVCDILSQWKDSN